MFDLHGAPGSQNGYDNSGRRGGPENKDGIHFLEDDNVNRTIKVLELVTQMISGWIVEEHISMDTVFGIELANEPWGKNFSNLYLKIIQILLFLANKYEKYFHFQ